MPKSTDLTLIYKNLGLTASIKNGVKRQRSANERSVNFHYLIEAYQLVLLQSAACTSVNA